MSPTKGTAHFYSVEFEFHVGRGTGQVVRQTFVTLYPFNLVIYDEEYRFGVNAESDLKYPNTKYFPAFTLQFKLTKVTHFYSHRPAVKCIQCPVSSGGRAGKGGGGGLREGIAGAVPNRCTTGAVQPVDIRKGLPLHVSGDSRGETSVVRLPRSRLSPAVADEPNGPRDNPQQQVVIYGIAAAVSV